MNGDDGLVSDQSCVPPWMRSPRVKAGLRAKETISKSIRFICAWSTVINIMNSIPFALKQPFGRPIECVRKPATSCTFYSDPSH